MNPRVIVGGGLLALGALALAETTLTGAGATFPAPLYEVMFREYNKTSGVRVAYNPVGSGAGQSQILAQAVDFGASDAFMTDEALKAVPRKLLHIPTAIGAVVPAYNLPGLTQPLRFDGALLADLYLGKIKSWNDRAVARLNPGVTLPPFSVQPVYRSDGSGTTAVFVDFLAKTSPAWANTVSKGPQTQVRFPTGLPGQGNAGVASVVRQTPGALGYVEASFARANNLQYGFVRNAAGRYVDGGDLKAVSAAASSVPLPADTRVSLTGAGGTAYPVAGFTWLLVYEDQNYAGRTVEQGKALANLLWWMTHDGQKLNEAQGYGELPTNAVSSAAALIGGMNHGGTKLR
jgi:phosphate transport system substrate-binding protein